MRNCIRIFSLLFFFVVGFVNGWSQESGGGLVERGRYIFSLAGGCACHSDPKGTPHAGARPFPIPFGIVYSSNITQDKETGLGGWSDKEIMDATIRGIRPNGSRKPPVMPYEAYSGMAEEDVKALIVFLRTLKPARKETPPPKSWVPLLRSVATPIWLRLFGSFYNSPAKAPEKGIERGRYLVEHVSLCSECHTPRNSIGVPNRTLYLAGAKEGPFGEEMPNITPDKETGIGEWSRNDIAEYLVTGIKPDLDNAQGLMAEIIEAGYRKMTKEDALAIADYLKSVPAIKNKVK